MRSRGPSLRAAALAAAGALLAAGVTAAPVAGADRVRPHAATTGTTGAIAEAAERPARDPRRTQGLYVDTRMPVFAQGPAYRRIAKKPQALWFGNEYYPTSSVASVAREYTRLAEEAGKTPMMVVYSIPDRDCGQYSAGGLPGGAEYKAWIKRLAAGIRGSKPLLVLEPDAIPFYGQGACQNAGDRLGLLRFATKRLSRAGAWVYLDAGHSGWTPYAGRAKLLKRAGIEHARGFSTNVSNFRTTSSEKRYARMLVGELTRLRVRGVKYVIDTSRNGARGGPQDGQVINPPWARIGDAPKLRFRGAFDGTLWVKHPGESDGYENSTAASGQWCDQLADRLLGRPESPGC